VDVRLLAATNRDIIEAIREDHFREDLYHRLNVVQFRLPPLRERGNDVLLLAEHFLKQFGQAMKKNIRSLSQSSKQKLLAHIWPGNVRELRNVIERALILETSDTILPGSLPDFQLETRLRKVATGKTSAGGEALDELVANFERDLINTMLEQNRFNLTKTAENLKLSRHALRYRMQRLNINLAEDDEDEPAAPKE
jgi:DNA-binding NtrC family response regulator